MKKILLGLAALYTVLLLLLYFNQEAIIFRAAPLPQNYHFSFDQPFREEFIASHDGVLIHTLFFPAKGRSKGLVFNNHGNRRNLSRWGNTANQFTDLGYDVFFYDYRGFGKTKGVPSEKDILQDADHLYKLMKTRYPEKKMVIYGRSLGTGVATYLAAKHNPRLLILETPYYNLADLGYSHLPVFPYQFLIRHAFRTDQWIEKVRCQIHIFHGTEDELVPYESSEKLVAKVGKPTKDILTTLEGGGHRGLHRFNEYQQKMRSLLY